MTEGDGQMKSYFKGWKLAVGIILVVLAAATIQIWNYYEIITKKYALDWGNVLRAGEMQFKDLLFVEEENNQLKYLILNQDKELRVNTIRPDGSMISEENVIKIKDYDASIFYRDVQYMEGQLFFLKNKWLYQVNLSGGMDKVESKIVGSDIDKFALLKDKKSGKIYYSVLKNEKEIEVYDLDNVKKHAYKSPYKIKAFNVAMNEKVYLTLVETITEKNDEMSVFSLEDLEKKNKLLEIDTLNGYNVYQINNSFLDDQLVLNYNILKNDKGSIDSDAQIMILDKSLNPSKLFKVNEHTEEMNAYRVGTEIKMFTQGRNIYFLLEALNAENSSSSYKNLLLAKLDENAVLESSSFVTNELTDLKMGGIVPIGEDKWIMGKAVKGNAYQLVINSNAIAYANKKEVSKDDITLAFKHGLTTPFYAIIMTFIHLLIVMMFLLVPYVVLGTVFFIKNVQNEKIKFWIMYALFIGVYVWSFSSRYISYQVIEYAPQWMTSGYAPYYMPLCFSVLGLGALRYYQKRIHVDGGYTSNLAFVIGFTVLSSTLIYIPFKYIEVIIMH